MRRCPNCNNESFERSQLFRAALGNRRSRCSICHSTVRLRIGTLPNFLLAIVNEIFLIIAILAGISAKSWIVFFILLFFPLVTYSWLFAAYGILEVYKRKDA